MKSGCAKMLVLLLFLVMCIAGMGAAWAGSEIPKQAEALFGPPTEKLSPLEGLTAAAKLMMIKDDLLQPANPDGKEVAFTIEPGESAARVAGRLHQQGLIRSADSFLTYLVYSGLDTAIQAGRFHISSQMTAVEIAHSLLDATPAEVPFRILPGWRAEEIAAALPTSGLNITPEDFLRLVRHPSVGVPMNEPQAELISMEGFLFPGVYTFDRKVSLNDFILTILKEFDTQVTRDIRDGFRQQGLTLAQGITLASIVQREAMVEDERPMIASVFLNRLRNDMRLESDPTTQYALGFDEQQKTWWTNPLSAADLDTESPYNTYVYKGLPPGPISNPGLSAIQAVAFPAQTDYFFFRARCDGSGRHNFAVTYQEHLQNACP